MGLSDSNARAVALASNVFPVPEIMDVEKGEKN